MLKTRIIPCLDVKDGRVVKGVNFVELKDAGDPVEQARLYDAQGADELCFLDISASHEGRATLYDVVRRVAEVCFMPLTVGGGVRTVEDIRTLLLAGADKVAINSAAVARPEFVLEAAETFGSQCIVVAIDAKRGSGIGDRDAWPGGRASRQPAELRPIAGSGEPAGGDKKILSHFEVFTHGGRNPTGLDAIEWAQRMESYGAGEILLTSMDRDGTKAGFNLPLTRAVSDAVGIPVVASGGVGKLEHFVEGVKEGHASALLAASVFHYGEFTIAQVKEALHAAGIAIRVPGA